MRFTDSSARRKAAKWVAPASYRAKQGVVVSYAATAGIDPRSHESVTRLQIAKKLAALKGCEFAGEYEIGARYGDSIYFVPSHTLVGLGCAEALGIESEDDFFGGVVPYPFVGTKTITHPLIGDDASAPHGWSQAFALQVRDAALSGYSAFSIEDARCAGERLLESGSVRVKPACAIGGRGQIVASDLRELDIALAAIDPAELSKYGLVLEQNLSDVTTYSVGQVRVADLVATYYGRQKLARDGSGAEVYGGSDLTVARGDFDALLTLDIDADARTAVEQARLYDTAAHDHYRGFFASRCNYDIARGRDANRQECCGVLEQSWRIGGASGAEVVALEAFRADPELNCVRAACTEVYGEDAVPPPGSMVYFRGVDDEVGFITKYTVVERYGDA